MAIREAVINNEQERKVLQFGMNRVLTETVKEQADGIKGVLETEPQRAVTREELEIMLTNHYKQMELLFDKYTKKVQDEPTASVGAIYTNLVKGINQSFTDFKDNFQKNIDAAKEKVIEKKENVKEVTQTKVKDTKVSINNFLVSKVQALNEKIKKFTTTIDEKFQMMEKGNQGDNKEELAAKEKAGPDNKGKEENQEEFKGRFEDKRDEQPTTDSTKEIENFTRETSEKPKDVNEIENLSKEVLAKYQSINTVMENPDLDLSEKNEAITTALNKHEKKMESTEKSPDIEEKQVAIAADRRRAYMAARMKQMQR